MSSATTYHPPQPAKKAGPGINVIHASLFRMGTFSMSAAYRILGFRVEHGMDEHEVPLWPALEQAAEATFPHAPGAVARPRYTREDWNRMWGNEFDVVTDLGSVFALEMIRCFPEAKVVVVQRDFEPWYKSLSEGPLASLFGPIPEMLLTLAYYTAGSRAKSALHKLFLGFFQANDRAQMDTNARRVYDEYFAEVRRLVPAENRLEYKLGDGWEPLCEFLGVPVPADVPFPRLNDAASQKELVRQKYKDIINRTIKKYGPMALGIASAGTAMLYASSMQRH